MQLPVREFDGVNPYQLVNEEDDDEWMVSLTTIWFQSNIHSLRYVQTLRELMGGRDIEELQGSPLVISSLKQRFTNADEKSMLKEDIRQEKAGRCRKRRELMAMEEEYKQVGVV